MHPGREVSGPDDQCQGGSGGPFGYLGLTRALTPPGRRGIRPPFGPSGPDRGPESSRPGVGGRPGGLGAGRGIGARPEGAWLGRGGGVVEPGQERGANICQKTKGSSGHFLDPTQPCKWPIPGLARPVLKRKHLSLHEFTRTHIFKPSHLSIK